MYLNVLHSKTYKEPEKAKIIITQIIGNIKMCSSYFHREFKHGSVEVLSVVKLCKEKSQLKPIKKRKKHILTMKSNVASMNGHLIYLGTGEEECGCCANTE